MSKSPEDVLKTIPRPKVLERLGSWHSYYLENIEPNFEKIFLNQNILRLAVERYFRKLACVKIYHGIKYGDAHKRAAFTMVAIADAHPIQLATDINLTESTILINEWYGLQLGLSQMDVDVAKISRRYLRNLVYLLNYRKSEEELLSSCMYLIDCAFQGKAVCGEDGKVI